MPRNRPLKCGEVEICKKYDLARNDSPHFTCSLAARPAERDTCSQADFRSQDRFVTKVTTNHIRKLGAGAVAEDGDLLRVSAKVEGLPVHPLESQEESLMLFDVLMLACISYAYQSKA
ncbi:hypothetical protein PRIPAC_91596 [Pristionchus pacificus]|uniref:Uncharacterized protein n=1 Tax=Pristionchus pacificus TaxID=54126 RepID=A0A2A6CE17_PRIPA|nr:hypothetical protein PRIPAC_91596 [Pristionchus pacificus]|eukprot:PDM76356.1 hypothetical protein PRIPAC_39960 [Pristionchus pacificus]